MHFCQHDVDEGMLHNSCNDVNFTDFIGDIRHGILCKRSVKFSPCQSTDSSRCRGDNRCTSLPIRSYSFQQLISVYLLSSLPFRCNTANVRWHPTIQSECWRYYLYSSITSQQRFLLPEIYFYCSQSQFARTRLNKNS